MLFIRAAFNSFRQLVRAGGTIGPAKVGQKMLEGGDGSGAGAFCIFVRVCVCVFVCPRFLCTNLLHLVCLHKAQALKPQLHNVSTFHVRYERVQA